jgi:hypothetical protein
MRKRKRPLPKLSVGAWQLQDRIEKWRRTRVKRTAMPEALWSEAVALARGEGMYRTARALGVDYESLKRRIAERAASDRGAAAPANAFVEVSGAQVLAAPSPGTVVDLTDENGARMIIRLSTGREIDVAQWIAAFRRRDGA